jgi:hypothetical protein
MPNPNARPPTRRSFFHRYALSLVLGTAFLLAWIGQGITEWFVVAQEAEQHGGDPTFSDYIWSFGQSTFENWQSEFLQLLAFVFLTALIIHEGSPESKDSDERTQAALERIEAKVDALAAEADRGTVSDVGR